MRRALAVVGLSLAVFALAPISVASAHASLENSIPAPNSVLEQSPPNIVLDFDEAIDAPLTSIELFDQTGVAVALGAPVSVGDSSIVQASVPDLTDGTYAVVWRVSSSDGHVVSGALSFQIGTTGAVVFMRRPRSFSSRLGAYISRVGSSMCGAGRAASGDGAE